MKLTVEYTDLTPEQKLRACWLDFCDADPVPPEFAEEMEAAGFAALRPVTKSDLMESFAYDRGIEPGGMLWELTPTGRAALRSVTPPETGDSGI